VDEGGLWADRDHSHVQQGACRAGSEIDFSQLVCAVILLRDGAGFSGGITDTPTFAKRYYVTR
jgi:hypothetical protein